MRHELNKPGRAGKGAAASLLLAGALIMAAGPVAAAEIEGKSVITAVTVFPAGAEITREFMVDVPEGRHQLIVKDLPARLENRSLRVEGAGAPGLTLGGIDHKVTTIPFGEQQDAAELERLETRFEQLRDERQLVNAEVEAAKLQKTLLQEMTKLPLQQGSGAQGGVVDLSAQYASVYGLLGEKFVEAERRQLAALVKLRALDKEINTLRRQIAEIPRDKRQVTRLVVDLVAPSSGTARFKVRYQVRGAGWRPLYEARLETGAEKSPLRLIRRAEIFQTSQEDWENVTLKLSTTNPQGRTMAPDLRPLFVDYLPDRKPKPVIQSMAKEELSEVDQMMADELPGGARKVITKRMAMAPAKPRGVKVSFGAYQMVFEVKDPTSVMRNGERKKVFLDDIAMDAKVGLITVPKKDRRAYVRAAFSNETGQALLAGDMALFRDGIYVGRSYLKAIEPGQEHDIGFGVDPKVNVKWVRLDRVKGETGLITSSNSDVHRYKITITNGHKDAKPVTVMDQIPYANEESLQISLLNASPKPTRRDVDDKKGIMAWDITAKPGSPRVIEFAYQLVWPKGKKVTLR